jgi:hypothetical protein
LRAGISGGTTVTSVVISSRACIAIYLVQAWSG